METIIIALIVSVIAPFLMAFITNFTQSKLKKEEFEQHRVEKHEDWKRQDEVAKKAAETSLKLDRYSETLISNSDKLDTIHKLVNGNTTALMRETLDAYLAELAWMREAKTLSGEIRSVESIAAMKELETKIRILQTKITDRIIRQLS